MSDLDRSDYLNGPYALVTCTDCDGLVDGTGLLCDECLDRRDAHTDALEIRLMVKAALRADWTKIREVA